MFTFIKHFLLIPDYRYVLMICLLWLGLSFEYANADFRGLRSSVRLPQFVFEPTVRLPQSALIIGNSQYEVNELNRSVENAKKIEKALKDKGFEVILETNLNRLKMDDAIRDFKNLLSQKGGIGLFYFSGYGTQVDGKNYLLPINNARIKDKVDIKYEAILLDKILENMQVTNSDLKIIILDTSPDTPYLEPRYRIKTGGLTSIKKVPRRTIIGYATALNSTTFRPGLYTKHLIKEIQTGGRIDDVFGRVSNAVKTASHNKQIPWHDVVSPSKIFCFGTCQKNSPHLALVIGNSQYEVGKLSHSVNDAKGIAEALEYTGFQVTLKKDLNIREMDDAIRKFRHRLSSKKGSTGLFYFFGYGTQVDGKNYLLPIDNAWIKDEIDVQRRSMSVNLILSQMQKSRNELNIILLDTALDTPYLDSRYRSKTGGLASIKVPPKTIIGYPTVPKSKSKIVYPGLYTKHLIKEIRTGGKIDDVLMRVHSAVKKESLYEQMPWHQPWPRVHNAVKKESHNAIKKESHDEQSSWHWTSMFCFGECQIKPQTFHIVNAPRAELAPSAEQIAMMRNGIKVLVSKFDEPSDRDVKKLSSLANLVNVMTGNLEWYLNEMGIDVVSRDDRTKHLLDEIMLFETTGKTGQYGGLQLVNFVIIGRIDSIDVSNLYHAAYSIETKKGKQQIPPQCKYKAYIRGTLRIYEFPQVEIIKSVNLKGYSSRTEDAISSSCQRNISSYASLIHKAGKNAIKNAIKYSRLFSPKGYVTEIRTNGKKYIAKVSIGKNQGLKKGTKVKVYHLRRIVNQLINQVTIEESKIANGKVTDHVYEQYAWIYIDDAKQGSKIKLGDYILLKGW